MISYNGVYIWKLFSLLKPFNWKMAKEYEEAGFQFRWTHTGAALCRSPNVLLLLDVPALLGDLAGAGPGPPGLSPCPLLFICITSACAPSSVDVTSGMYFPMLLPRVLLEPLSTSRCGPCSTAGHSLFPCLHPPEKLQDGIACCSILGASSVWALLHWHTGQREPLPSWCLHSRFWCEGPVTTGNGQ